MPIDLTWGVTKEVAGWVGSARNAARTRSQKRIANIVEHTGILVAGVNRLNALTVRLLRPLVYFDPSEWDAQSRAGLVRDVILLADESTVVPRMRAARSALRSLLVAVDDIDIQRPATLILAMADDLFRYDSYLDGAPQADDREPNRGAGALIGWAGRQLYGPDSMLADVLPHLVDLIRSAEHPDQVRRLRYLADTLTTIEPDRMPRLSRRAGLDLPSASDTTGPLAGVLAPYAASMQGAFGELIGAQQRVFPEMPSPTWAFSDG